MNQPSIFISCVSPEFRQTRSRVAAILTRLGYTPVVQEIFGTEPGDLCEVLRGKIDACDGLIQIIGHGYGAEPPMVDANYGRVSYTQFEFLYARSQKKKTWLLFAGDACTRDTPLDRLDLSHDPTHLDPGSYQAERRALQLAYSDKLRNDGHFYYDATSDTDLELKVERLRDELAELRQAFKTWQKEVLDRLTNSSAGDLRLLRQLADRVRNLWVAGVLEPSVHQAAMIALRTEQVGDAVQHPWERVLELPDRLRQPLPSEKKVGEIFSDVGALLILGEPGAGKTVTLLELARDLLDRFEADPGQPLPVVLHLSAWRETRRSRTSPTPFSAWVEAELKDKYSVPGRRTRTCLAKSQLCLLLDGLDEVRAQERAGCVRAINEFLREVGVPGIAVCSRVTEYVAIGERLRFSGAIRIQPLTKRQIDGYLERVGSGLAALRHEVQKDPVLQELAQSPLMLSVMALAYHNLPIEEIADSSADTVENRRKRVLDRYVDRMFQRAPRKASASYPEEHAKRWLGWLGAHMAEESRTVFRLEDLQPSWLPSTKQLWVYALSSRLCAAIFTSALLWAVARMLDPLLRPEEWQRLDWNLHKINLMLVLVVGTTAGVVLGLMSSRRFTGGVKNQSPRAVGLGCVAEGLLVTLVIVGVFGALAAPPFEPVALMFGFCLVLSSLVSYRYIRNQQLVPYTAANDIRLAGPLQLSFAAALRGAKAEARSVAISAGFLLMAIFFVILLLWGLFQPGALLRIDTYRLAISFAWKAALLLAVTNAVRIVWVGANSAMGMPPDLPETARPGEGLSFSLRNATLYGVVAFGGVFLYQMVGPLLGRWVLHTSSGGINRALLAQSMAMSLWLGVSVAMWNGGFDALKHVTLRVMLHCQNLIPRDLVAFLEHATRLIFLRKIGPGYIFIHRLLLEHFAGIQPPLETTPLTSSTPSSAEWFPKAERYLVRDYANALPLLHKAADAGSTDAMFNLGWLYHNGWGVAQDYGKAREWYQKAADAGSSTAMSNLGPLYMNGWGVAQDYGKAREWYQKAADAGSSTAMSNLGLLYMNGWGVAQDYGKAREWYQKAADAGSSFGMHNLGWLYQNGWGVAQDYGKAREWYQKAAHAGLAQAKQALSRLRLKRLVGFWSLRRRPRNGHQ